MVPWARAHSMSARPGNLGAATGVGIWAGLGRATTHT